MPALAHATEPDLSADFFIKAYAISFAAAIMLWGILLVRQFVDVARGNMAGADFVDVLFLRSGIFLGGALFGPWVGVFLVKFFGSMSQSLIAWGVGSSSDRMLETMNDMLDKDPSAIPGGVIIGILLMICMILGFLLVLLMLVVMLVTLYISGAVMPLGLVWIASNRHHELAWKIPTLWLGLLAAHPLLFFLMGFAFNMIASTSTWMKWDDGLVTLMNLVAAVVAMAIAGMSPVLLMKFAPIMPSGAGQQAGPSMSAPSKGGSQPPQEVQTIQDAKASSRRSMQEKSSQDPETGSGGGDEATKDPGSLVNHLRSLKAGKGGGETGTESPAPGDSQSPGAGIPKPVPAAGGGAGAGAGAAGAEGVGAGTAAGGAGAAGAGAAAGAGGGAGAVAAAGAAESSTGAGAAIGVPTMLAAGAMAAGEKAKELGEEGLRMSEAAGQYAAGDMKDDTEG
ncbi:hypothetical protein [Arthrobacter sp.]|uniref:hypothetical protein n=1 Tax=Arthrobacter sp. TaxID=1667 RepID=UPI003A94C34D